ncbi:MAG: B12-binding domain-containing radical SAM protein [Planctomycetota bacterium]
MRVLLVAPCREGQRWKGRRRSRFLWPPMALMILAAETPEGVEVVLTDEAVAPAPLDRSWDLVGVSALTASATRAYAVADAFRELGVPVILGGIHPSFRPEEASEHADSVFVGEADDGWAGVVEDVRSGRGLAPRYEAKDHPDLTGRPYPRRDLLPRRAYGVSNTLMASRGCPHDCSFCSTTRFMGKRLRRRPVEAVAKEAGSLPGRIMIFTDDNLFAHKGWALDLMEALRPLRKRWVAQCSVEAAKRADLLRGAKRAGCMGVLVGFESLSPENLEDVRKGVNKVEAYVEAVRAFHEAGLFVQGSFIFGLDGDGPHTLEETLDFVFRARLEGANFSVLTPLPGTDVFSRFEAEGRIRTRDWSLYDKLNVVYEPKGFTAEALRETVKTAYRRVYSLGGIWRRVPLLARNGPIAWLYNLNYRRGIARGWD